MRQFSGALAVCLLVAGAGCDSQSPTAAEVQPARQLRDPLPGFTVRTIAGPEHGHIMCLCCRYGLRPVVVVFTRDLNDDVQELVHKIDVKVGENADKKMAAFLVVLTEDDDAIEPRLKALAEDAGIVNTPLTILAVPTPRPEYRIADDAEVTVVMYVEKEMKVHRSFSPGALDNTAIEALIAYTNKILD